MDLTTHSLLAILEVVWVNILLSGDNAVVIALACRGLPEHQRRLGMILGAGVAILLRVVFTALVAWLLETPLLKLAGGILLLWIAVQLLTGDEEGDESVKSSDRLLYAVRTVALADMVMSLDNVLAIAAVAKGNYALLIFGLVISIPLIVAGASLIMSLLGRLPILVWAGAALLGWVAGQMLIDDPWLVGRLGAETAHSLELPVEIIAAVFVLAVGFLLRRRAQQQEGAHGA